jgi:PAS domain S-box-containing protein
MKPTYEELQERVAGLERALADCSGKIAKMDSLEEQNRKFEATLAQSPSSIIITNEFGSIEYINSMFSQTLGYSPEEMKEELMLSILKDQDSASQYENLKNAIQRGEIWRGEMKIARKDGQLIWIWLITFPLYHLDKIQNYVILFNDITKHKLIDLAKQEREAIYKTLVENLPLAITIYDEDGRILFVNEITEEFFPSQKGNMTGKLMHDLYPRDIADEQLELIRQVYRSGKPQNIERNFNIQGREVKFKVTRQPVMNESGQVTSVMSIAQNISEEARKEQVLHIRQQIDSLSNITSDLKSSLDLVFQDLMQIPWIDAGGLYLMNYEKEVLELAYHTGLSHDFVANTSLYSKDSANARVAFNKKPRYVGMENYFSSTAEDIGKENISFVAALPLVYYDKVIGLLNLASRKVTVIDEFDRQAIESIALKVANLIELITTRMELDRSNRELQAKLKELGIKQQMLVQKSRLESLGELLAGLAHEINQPLSVISLAMENINYKLERKTASEAYLSGKIATINQQITKIRELIEHVRLFSRDQESIMFERVDVNQVIMNALSIIGSQLRYHRIKVTTDLPENIGYSIGNPFRFEQVIMNLLSNARDALDEKEKKSSSANLAKEIRITTCNEENNIIIQVWDNGTGISAENIDKIFNPFYTTKAEGGGTGLGLPIVYGIIREMKGDITIHSDHLRFTEITLTLPSYINPAEKK